ncbi:TPA: EpsG family protein [Escherichia coli]|uniref:EpsG family protein n=1 Tax=Escherichia coli TaxID=562 RepID=UPI00111500F9|nr:EpsG family protein [Escherichia coli]WIF93042.1 EpsG family protein [Escherichia coli]HAW3243345.1 EpsG family protein [Escherichia coli]HCJ8236881.1 EpsG family protein [Escherichia coli]HCJ9109027.1 EpsG family protein [Escherichia coli]HCJ9135121.1 EpsG family protein [Escherichia coli]
MARKLFILYMVFVFLIIVSLLIGLRTLGLDSDFVSYSVYYANIANNLSFSDTRYEPGFVLLSYVFKEILNVNIYVMLSFLAFISLVIKEFIFLKDKHSFFITLIYLVGIGLLHEMTQIRVAVAVSFVLLALYFESRGRYYLTFVLLILSITFHYSMFFFTIGLIIPNNWLNNNKIRIPIVFLYAIIIAFVIYFIQGILIDNIDMLRVYASRADGETFNFISVRFIGLAIPLLIGVFAFDKFSVFQKKCFIISLAAYVLSIPTSLIPTLASRLFELGWVCFYFWVPGIRPKNKRIVALVFLAFVSFYFAFRNIYLIPIFGIYEY